MCALPRSVSVGFEFHRGELAGHIRWEIDQFFENANGTDRFHLQRETANPSFACLFAEDAHHQSSASISIGSIQNQAQSTRVCVPTGQVASPDGGSMLSSLVET